MNQLQLNKILSIIIIIISCIIIYFINHNKYENFNSSNEAIQNIGNVFSNINNTVSINKLNIKGTVNFKQLKGIIVAWSGSIATIPSGWGLCDGTIYNALDGSKLQTPDLRSKFILGSSSTHPLNTQGGTENHLLGEAEIPAHTHSTNSNIILSCYNPFNQNIGYLGGNCGNNANFVTTTSSYAGGNQPHNNMPPYYALAYIIKL